MKKIIAAALCLALCASMSVTAFAESVTTSGGTGSGNVKAKYSKSDRTESYKVDISWGGMEFDYTAAGEVWDAETHEWKASGTPAWTLKSGSSDEISFANHSSTDITVQLSFATDSTYSSVTGQFKNGGNPLAESKFTMSAATKDGGATEYTATFVPGGTLASNSDTNTNYTKVGTITATIN